eukprot:TRINITY_DN371_c0_g1_i2.p4 TRINITY_DN371_c0_g1~~TRINITY_DN371_c0_g1_i2.p4  ORF type:complete len:172 (-),score=36.39 TRINITY_DN371_c0_g1_i2:167-682(-)
MFKAEFRAAGGDFALFDQLFYDNLTTGTIPQGIYFMFTTFMLMVVLISLCVAFVMNAFNIVTTQKQKSHCYERAQLINYIETILSAKTKLELSKELKESYIYFSTAEIKNEEVEKLVQKQELRTRVEQLEKSIVQLNEYEFVNVEKEQLEFYKRITKKIKHLEENLSLIHI